MDKHPCNGEVLGCITEVHPGSGPRLLGVPSNKAWSMSHARAA